MIKATQAIVVALLVYLWLYTYTTQPKILESQLYPQD